MLRPLARLALAAVVLAVALVVSPLRALAAYSPPPLAGAVTDTANALSKEERARIERRLSAYRAKTTNEVVVFVLPSLRGETIEDVAYGAFNGWHLGKKDQANGVLLVLAMAERKMRIETGKGIGDKLTDVESGRILRERIGPFLKVLRTAEGIEAGLDAIEAALDGRPAPPIPTPSVRGAASAPAPGDVLAPLAPSRVRIFDRTSRFAPEEVEAENRRLQEDWTSWRGVAVVIHVSSAQFTDMAATSVRTQTGEWPVVVQISADDRKVNVSAPPDFGEERKAELRRRLLQMLTPENALDLALVRQIGPMVAMLPVAPPPPAPSGSSILPSVVAVLIVGLVLAVILWGIFRKKGRGRGRGGSWSSSDSSSWSSGSDYSSSSSSDYSSSGSDYSSGGGSDYSGGGGDSGGGGASDSW